MFRAITLIFGFFASCAHDTQEVTFARFPQHFSATQAIRVESKHGQDALIAKLSRHDQDIKVVFLEPLFFQAILTQESNAEKTTTKWHKDIALPFDTKNVMHLIRTVYLHKNYAMQDGRYTLEMPDAKVSLSQIETPCAFPKKLDVTFAATPPIKLSITTEEVTCPN